MKPAAQPVTETQVDCGTEAGDETAEQDTAEAGQARSGERQRAANPVGQRCARRRRSLVVVKPVTVSSGLCLGASVG